MLEGRGVGRTIFFLGALFPAERLLGRNHPLKAAVLVHDSLKEVRISCDQGEGGAKKIGGVLRNSSLRLATFNLFDNLSEARIGGAQASDPRIVLLDEAGEGHIR